ncbi:MAG: SDR family oxidoreductase [SAR324 cluster bacterium]|nr:SDR family oxidoreductase [SAR324 cluster bacterium]MED5241463.1 SDR family oxidoreductase [SAR324 cluster bacterium]MED5515575.1 SDR family oxidoreductase [SAR324 cluster bacterium]HAF89073.1 short chain dehydrogenase [Deltaproteobacteria bacterium]|tara:strand:- start:99 stop:845 length:747 start_codon:yes stop_codon:yes gene_type:complete
MRLKNKIAIITGAGSGFGKGIAIRFAEEEAKVVIVDINIDSAEKVAMEIGKNALAIKCDVSQDGDVASLFEQTLEQFGSADILVNNAGTTHRNKPMTEVTEKEFDQIFAVNVKSVFLTAKHGVPLMKKQGQGVILNVASTAGQRPRPGLTWYNTSKGAMITATKAMAIELATFKIRVNAINPVAGETGMLHLFMGEDTPEKRAQFVSSIPWGRLSQPEDMSNAALFLCSEEADMITGTCMDVDGGRCI